MFGHISASDVNSLNRIVDGETFEHRSAVTHTIAAVQHKAGGFATSVQTQHCLLLEKDFGGSKLLKEYVCSLSSITEWIEWWLRQQYWMFLGLDFKLCEHMLPESLHVVPVLDYSVLNWVS